MTLGHRRQALLAPHVALQLLSFRETHSLPLLSTFVVSSRVALHSHIATRRGGHCTRRSGRRYLRM